MNQTNDTFRCPKCKGPYGEHDSNGAMHKCHSCGWHSESAAKRSDEVLKANGYDVKC